MSYLLKIVVPSVPQYNHDAFGFADALLRESKGLPPSPRLVQFHDAITERFPCFSSGIYLNDENSPVCPWGDAPLIDCFTGNIGVLRITARNIEVIPFLLRRAGALALTVIDEQAPKVHRPATFSLTLDSIQKNVDRKAVAAKLVPLLKRTPEDVNALLATRKSVLMRRLNHVSAQRFSKTLDLVGCNCTIEKETPEGVTIPISGPGAVPPPLPTAQNDVYDSSLPGDNDMPRSSSWLARLWGRISGSRQQD